MTQVRVVYRPDGGHSIISLAEKGRKPNETDAEMFTRGQNKMPELIGLPFEDMDAKDVPPDKPVINLDKVQYAEAESKDDFKTMLSLIAKKMGLKD